MARPSFYQLYEMVLAEGPFWDMLKSHAKTGWELGRGFAPPPTPLPAWLTGLFSKPPREVDTDPLAGGADDPFGVGHDDPFDGLDDPFSEPSPPHASVPLSFSQPKTRPAGGKKQPEAQPGAKFRKYYPFGTFSSFYIEKPLAPRLKGKPGLRGATKVGGDALLRQVRAKYRQEHKREGHA